MSNPVTTPLTLRSALAYIAAHPGCTINDIGEAHGLSFETARDDAEFLDREGTVIALVDVLYRDGYVRYVVTSNGWQYTATGHGAWS